MASKLRNETLRAAGLRGRSLADRRSVLEATTPILVYEPHTWGPEEIDLRLIPPGGWHIPVSEEQDDFHVVQ